MARGSLRIYLGAAPGVGKTYAMLNEGNRRADRGADVVIGIAETHRRVFTEQQLGDLPTIPRRRVAYRDTVIEEMDVDAILARRPKVVLVDEYAHTNAPGSRNEKRWEDVEELLDAGIDVISTLNIQHLESLNDVVARITGITQQETVPDAIVRRADQFELVDIAPEALRRRMAHGNIYPAERIDAALSNYFRPGNLGALRELALLWVAGQVEDKLSDYLEDHGITQVWETRERVVVGITGAPGGDQLIRRAARMAGRVGGDLIGVHVAVGDGLSRDSRRRARRSTQARPRARRHSARGRRPLHGRSAGRLRPGREGDPARRRVVAAQPVVRAVARLVHRVGEPAGPGNRRPRDLERGRRADRSAGLCGSRSPGDRAAAGSPRVGDHDRRPSGADRGGGRVPRRGGAVDGAARVPRGRRRCERTRRPARRRGCRGRVVVARELVHGRAALHADDLRAGELVSLVVFVAVGVTVGWLVDVASRRGAESRTARAEAEALARAAADLSAGPEALPELVDHIRTTFALAGIRIRDLGRADVPARRRVGDVRRRADRTRCRSIGTAATAAGYQLDLFGRHAHARRPARARACSPTN